MSDQAQTPAVEEEPLAEDSLHQKTLDEDLAALLALGLQLADVERLWRQNKEVDMADVYASAAGLLGQPGAMASVRSAADANYVGPERFKFNEKSNQPERAANAPLPMLAETRALLLSFFNDHWDAAFEDDDDDRATDPCA